MANTTPSGSPIQTPIYQHGLVNPNTGQPTAEYFRWSQQLTTYLNNGTGPNLASLTTLVFLGLRRSTD